MQLLMNQPFHLSVSTVVFQFGSIVSPILFLLFIKNLLFPTNNFIHSYTDDMPTHSSTSPFCSILCCSIHVSSRLNFCKLEFAEDIPLGRTWPSQFKAIKSKFHPISRSKTPHDFSIFVDGSMVPPVNAAKTFLVSPCCSMYLKSLT